MKFFQLQVLVQQKRKKIRTWYIAQKKRLGRFLHSHFDSKQKNINWNVWQLFYEKIAIFWQKYAFFPKNLTFFQLQALVRKKRGGIRTCYIAQKKRLSLYFYSQFDSGQKNENWTVWQPFYKKIAKRATWIRFGMALVYVPFIGLRSCFQTSNFSWRKVQMKRISKISGRCGYFYKLNVAE